jgi:transposase
MARPLVSDELWELIEPLIPKVKRRYRYPGRKRIDDRSVLRGILFVLQTGIPWEYLPQEMGCGSGMTCWRRLREWQEAGVWQRLHELLLARLNEADRIDWSRAAIDSSHVRAFGGRKDRPEPGRPRTARLQAPPDRLRPGHAARCLAHRRQPQRHHPAAAAGRCDPARARTPRAAASWNTMANAEEWAAGLSAPAYAVDDETAFKVVDGTVEVVSEGQWKLLTPELRASTSG